MREQSVTHAQFIAARVPDIQRVIANASDRHKLHFLDGTLGAKLSTAFDTDGLHQGFHSGEFVWTGQAGLTVKGRMSGITNTGTHRKPIKDCQTCRDRGIMEGKLCGEVIEAGHPKLKGCQVIAAYRIKFDPSEKGGEGGVVGTIEGVIVCFCTA